MTAPTLTEFLLARIAEDESVARAAGSGSWDALDGGVTDIDAETWPVVSSEVPGGVRGDRAVRVHIANHDPARVLAECEAKRRIVGYRGAIGLPEDGSVRPGEGMTYLDGGHAAVAAERERILHLLALPYADHPDYDEAWRP